MIVQILRRLRRAKSLQIFRRGNNHTPTFSKLAGHERTVGQRTKPDRHVRLSGRDIHNRIGQADIDKDMRIALSKKAE